MKTGAIVGIRKIQETDIWVFDKKCQKNYGENHTPPWKTMWKTWKTSFELGFGKVDERLFPWKTFEKQ